MSTRILVTGGAGYIGSHVVKQLGDAGFSTVTYDNLSTGNRSAVLSGEFILGDVGDEQKLCSLISTGFDAVMHFAANVVVPESVVDPLRYYENNTINTFKLWRICAELNVPSVIFSSTAAVYGAPAVVPVKEEHAMLPINPYGASKMMSERMLSDISASGGPSYVSLRYFNVAGADPDGRIGQSTPNATHLIKVACEAAVGKRDLVTIFGNDYETPDGTCIRDYIHVEDLARAHLDALKYLLGGGKSATLNCGYGTGYSVREVLDMVQEVCGSSLCIVESARRAGDPPVLVAEAEKIRRILGWTPTHFELKKIVTDAYNWERLLKIQNG